jgi:hypothetical protein
MLHTFQKKPTYFSVHALRDGTIWLALQGRKPSKKNKPVIDEDGIYQWFLDEPDAKTLPDWGKGILQMAITTNLNVKRIVRQQVENKLDLILEKLVSIEQRLGRLERERTGN